MAANFASGVGPCAGIVESFKHLLRVTAHPQILVLELQAAMDNAVLYLYFLCLSNLHDSDYKHLQCIWLLAESLLITCPGYCLYRDLRLSI